MTNLYDRLAATQGGSRLLAQARIRREVLRLLRQAQAASGLSIADIATATGDRRREVKRDFDGDGNVRLDVLARYLHAMGYELDLRLVPVGEPRQAVVEQRDVRPAPFQRWADLRPDVVSSESRVAEARAALETDTTEG